MISFPAAKEEPAMRANYIREIDLEEALPYIKQVQYDPVVDAKFLMQTRYHLLSRFGIRGLRSRIIVTSNSFDQCETENEFLSMLIDHEGWHARDYFCIPQKVCVPPCSKVASVHFEPERVIRNIKHVCISERRALRNQLRKRSKRSLSEGFIEELLSLERCFLDLMHAVMESSRSPECYYQAISMAQKLGVLQRPS